MGGTDITSYKRNASTWTATLHPSSSEGSISGNTIYFTATFSKGGMDTWTSIKWATCIGQYVADYNTGGNSNPEVYV